MEALTLRVAQLVVERQELRIRGASAVSLERNRDDIGFRLLRRYPFDLDFHGGAMLADGLRSLLPREGDMPSARCGR